MSEKAMQKKRGGRVLDFIERAGNRLPHPYILFLWLCLILAVISMLCSAAGVSVVNPTTGDTVTSNSLISKDGFVWLLENLLTNFQTFTPLGLVLAMQIAIGFAEKVGLLTTAMRRAILGVPLWCLTATVLFLGINGSIASEASIIVVPALAAAAFESVGMHPVAGLLAGYAATNAGFTACIIVAGTDVLLSGVTESAAQLIDPAMTVNATCNWYFMFVSVFTLTVAGVFVNKKFIVPRLGIYQVQGNEAGEAGLTERQGKALRAAGIFSVLFILAFALMVIPRGGILRGEDGSILNGPFIAGLVPILIFYFILVGVVYGVVAGTLKNSSDVPLFMAQALEGMTGYIVLVFVIAQFINMFSYTNLGMIIAVKSADALQAAGFTGIPDAVLYPAVLRGEPVYDQRLREMVHFRADPGAHDDDAGLQSGLRQVIYRIGDSCTNAITPIYPYIPIAIGMAKKYDKEFGMGSLISMMLPYSIAFLLVWVVQMVIWVVFNLPLGPGVQVFL